MKSALCNFKLFEKVYNNINHRLEMLQNVFIQWNIAVRKMNQSTFIILNEMTTNITLHEKIKLEKQWHVLFMVTALCGKHVKSSMIKIIIQFSVVVTPGEGNGRGRHTESINNICNVYSFEIRRRMKIQLVFDQTICGYTGVCYVLHTFFWCTWTFMKPN